LTLRDAAIAGSVALFCARSTLGRQHQCGGTVLDQGTKPFGRFSHGEDEASLAPRKATLGALLGDRPRWGTTIEPKSGFAEHSRRSSGWLQDVAITLFVDAISQSVTVQDSVSSLPISPAGNILDATSAKTEILKLYPEFHVPGFRLPEVLNSAGNVQHESNGIGLGKPLLPASRTDNTITPDRIPFEDTNSPAHHPGRLSVAGRLVRPILILSGRASTSVRQTSPGQSMKSRNCRRIRHSRIFSYSSFNAGYSVDGDSGLFGPGRKRQFL
jgi:hypothetical protein